MGVASGRLRPLPAYEQVRPACLAARDRPQSHLALSVATAEGELLPSAGGVVVADYSSELGPTEIEVSILGIAYPLYEQLFPSHVASYKRQFGSSAP
jgi:hypothetical protein